MNSFMYWQKFRILKKWAGGIRTRFPVEPATDSQRSSLKRFGYDPDLSKSKAHAVITDIYESLNFEVAQYEDLPGRGCPNCLTAVRVQAESRHPQLYQSSQSVAKPFRRDATAHSLLGKVAEICNELR